MLLENQENWSREDHALWIEFLNEEQERRAERDRAWREGYSKGCETAAWQEATK
jgi:hypothetical protein